MNFHIFDHFCKKTVTTVQIKIKIKMSERYFWNSTTLIKLWLKGQNYVSKAITESFSNKQQSFHRAKP